MAENPGSVPGPQPGTLDDIPGQPEENVPSLRPEDAGIVIALGTLLGNVVGIVVNHAFLVSLIGMLPMVFLAVRYTRKRGVPLSRAFPLTPVPRALLVTSMLVYLSVKVIEVDIMVAIDLLSGGSLSGWGEMFPSAGTGLSLPQALIATAVVAPVVEELVFRGFCYECFTGWNTGWSAVFPSLIFACFHHPLGIPSAFLAGMLLSILRRQSSLLATMLVHAVCNGFLTVAALLLAASSPYTLLLLLIVVHLLVLTVLVINRRHIKELWLEFRSLLKQFFARPQFGVRMRLLLKHWSYKVILLLIALTFAAMLVTPYLIRHLEL